MVRDSFGNGIEQECVAVISNFKMVQMSLFTRKIGRIMFLRSRGSDELFEHAYRPNTFTTIIIIIIIIG